MPRSTYFVQECPTCGRTLRVRVEYLGKSVRCQHCGAGFDACDPSMADAYVAEPSSSIMDRVNQLLASSGDVAGPT